MVFLGVWELRFSGLWGFIPSTGARASDVPGVSGLVDYRRGVDDFSAGFGLFQWSKTPGVGKLDPVQVPESNKNNDELDP